MKQLIVLSALTLTLVSGTVFAKESLGDSSSYKTLASHNISVSVKQTFHHSAPVLQVSTIVKNAITETQNTFDGTLKAGLNAKIEAIMSASLR